MSQPEWQPSQLKSERSAKPPNRWAPADWRDFLIGFIGWYAVNGLFWWRMMSNCQSSVGCGENIFFNLVILPANLAVMIVLALIPRTRRIANGVAATYVVNFALGLLANAVTAGVCWVPFFAYRQ